MPYANVYLSRVKKAVGTLHEYAIALKHGKIHEPGYDDTMSTQSAANISKADHWISNKMAQWRREGRLNRFDLLKVEPKPHPWTLDHIRKMFPEVGSWDVYAIGISLDVEVPEDEMENIRAAIKEIVRHEIRVIFGEVAIAARKEAVHWQADTLAGGREENAGGPLGLNKKSRRIYKNPDTGEVISKKELMEINKARRAKEPATA